MLQSQPNPLPSPTTHEIEKRKRIRDLNDTFRRQDTAMSFMLGEFYKAPRIQALPWGDQWAIMDAVKKYQHFDETRDPNGQHDFGAFVYKDQRIFWKIDYRDSKTLGRHSDDPSNPERTVRVLTIHLAEDPDEQQ